MNRWSNLCLSIEPPTIRFDGSFWPKTIAPPKDIAVFSRNIKFQAFKMTYGDVMFDWVHGAIKDKVKNRANQEHAQKLVFLAKLLVVMSDSHDGYRWNRPKEALIEQANTQFFNEELEDRVQVDEEKGKFETNLRAAWPQLLKHTRPDYAYDDVYDGRTVIEFFATVSAIVGDLASDTERLKWAERIYLENMEVKEVHVIVRMSDQERQLHDYYQTLSHQGAMAVKANRQHGVRMDEALRVNLIAFMRRICSRIDEPAPAWLTELEQEQLELEQARADQQALAVMTLPD
jgi:hypothetical protein